MNKRLINYVLYFELDAQSIFFSFTINNTFKLNASCANSRGSGGRGRKKLYMGSSYKIIALVSRLRIVVSSWVILVDGPTHSVQSLQQKYCEIEFVLKVNAFLCRCFSRILPRSVRFNRSFVVRGI